MPGILRPQLRQVTALESAYEVAVGTRPFAVIEAPLSPSGEGVGVKAVLRFVKSQHKFIFHFSGPSRL